MIVGPEHAVLDASVRPPAEPALFGPGWRETVIASPAWLRRGHDPLSFRPVMTVHAEDDRGGSYLAGPTGERHHYPIGPAGQDAVEVVIKLWPRLDPLARALALTFEGPSEQVTLDVAW